MKNSKATPFVSYLVLFLGVIFLSISPLFVRWANAPGVVTSFYRMVVAICVTGLILLISKRKLVSKKIPGKLWLLPILAGIASALDHAFWSTAIENTHIANATLLNYIAPLWVGIIAIFLLHEKYSGIFWPGMALVLTGAFAVSGARFTDFSKVSFAGEGFAIISSFFYAAYFIFSQKARHRFRILPYLFVTSIVSLLVLGLIIFARGLPIFGYERSTYLVFLTAGLFSQLGGYFCLFYALGNIPASIVSSILVLQPVITSLLAIRLFGEKISMIQIIGGVFVLGGIYLINSSKTKIQNLPVEEPEISGTSN
ncbi:MAG: DMT family transporter [Anaerolineaceae bacterium]|nr:DMT family transporter [Anaerolineaceae bacterium]